MIMCSLISVLSIVSVVSSQSVFTSVYHMGRLVNLEKNILSELKNHAHLMEAALSKIEKYVKEVSKVYKECEEEECSEKDTEDILGNPIHNYQLLKRVTVTWKKVQESIEAVDNDKLLKNLRKLKKKEKLPTDGDKSFAAKSLNNLQEVYQLQSRDLAEGRLDGVDTGASLSEQDLFYLGTQASNNKKPGIAVNHLQQALNMFQQQNISSDNQNYRKIENLLNRETRRLKPMSARQFVLGQVPPKSNDPALMTTEQDKINYHMLCQGNSLLSENIRKRLKCYYSNRFLSNTIFSILFYNVNCFQKSSLLPPPSCSCGGGPPSSSSDPRVPSCSH